MSVQAVMNRQLHAPTSARPHVLAVDDDPVIREAISDYLGQYNFRITAVADGRAMQAVLAHDELESDPAQPRYICTERGAGYVFNARVDIVY
jgi:DNA-binding response OmpR family regulator